MPDVRPVHPSAIYVGMDIIWEERKVRVLAYAFTWMGNLVVRVKEVALDGTLVDYEELENLGTPEWLMAAGSGPTF